MNTQYKYIHFTRTNRTDAKTSRWECCNNKSLDHLGTVQWYGAWRQYCFLPYGETVFNTGCLADIQDFIKQLMDARKTEGVVAA